MDNRRKRFVGEVAPARSCQSLICLEVRIGPLRLLSLQCGQRCLDLIILIVLVLDIVVDTGDFLFAILVFKESPLVYHDASRYLLKCSNDLAQGFISSVFVFVPMEGLQILFGRL